MVSDFRMMLHNEAIYLYPTPELVEYLSKLIHGHNTIEVGSGKGLLCDALGIKGTDSKYQATQEGWILQAHAAANYQIPRLCRKA